MSTPTQVTFADDYATDDESIHAGASALERGDLVTVRWPARTAELLRRKEEGRSTILDDLQQRGGDASGIKQFDSFLHDAQGFASASNRTAHLWQAVRALNANPATAALALAAFARFANLHILAAISNIELEGENLGLEVELREGELNKLYNSPAGKRALGCAEPIYAIDVEVTGPTSGGYIFAPASLIGGLRVGDKVHGDLLTRWTIPQSEVHLADSDVEPDYRELTIWHVRDDEFKEI